MRVMVGTSGYERISDDPPVPPTSAVVVTESNLDDDSLKTIPVSLPCTLSAWTFTWFQPIILLGEKKVITKHDMLELPPCLTSKEVLATFMQCWTLETLRLAITTSGFSPTTLDQKKPKLWRVLHTMIQKEFWTAGICRFFNDVLLVSFFLLQRRMYNCYCVYGCLAQLRFV